MLVASVGSKSRLAFTLIELLVVVAIIGVLTLIVVPNLVGIRARARDSARKSDLRSLKSALQIYYTDFQVYPDDNGAGLIMGCGTGTGLCSGVGFTTDDSVYMAELPAEYTYSQTDAGDGFEMYAVLENASDEQILDSQTKCSIALPADPLAYYECEN